MTPETSNGTASDDQRCYIERLQRIETAAQSYVEKNERCCHDDCADIWGVDDDHKYWCQHCILSAALEANR